MKPDRKPDRTSAAVRGDRRRQPAGRGHGRSSPVEPVVPVDCASRVLALRAKHGWSQFDLADRLGVSRASVPRWESGEYEPRPLLWARIEALEAGEPLPFPAGTGYGHKEHVTPREARLVGLLRETVEAMRDDLMAAGDKAAERHPVLRRKAKLIRKAEVALERLEA